MKYLYTIKIPFEAMDDIEARKIARELQADIPASKESSSKLQEVFIDKPPRGISI